MYDSNRRFVIWILLSLTAQIGIADENDPVVDNSGIDFGISSSPVQDSDRPQDNDRPQDSGKQPDESDYSLTLDSGRTIQVGALFGQHLGQMKQALSELTGTPRSAFLRINHQGSDQAMLIAGRRGKVLHGPFASFSDDGSPVALGDYKRGQRETAMLTWDEDRRPLVFAQYEKGKLHGLRCLFTACCEECQSGHLWMVQEWEKGQLQFAHLVSADEEPISVPYRRGESLLAYGDKRDRVDLAITELEQFENRFESDELKLKQWASEYYFQERRVTIARANLLAAQQRYRFTSGIFGGNSGSRSFAASGSLGFT